MDLVLKISILFNKLGGLPIKWGDLVETENPYKPFYMYTETTDVWIDKKTGITYNDVVSPIYRWRQAYQNDFEARIDWCIKTNEEANHNPVTAFLGDTSKGIVYLSAKPGETVLLDASASSNPDMIHYHSIGLIIKKLAPMGK